MHLRASALWCLEESLKFGARPDAAVPSDHAPDTGISGLGSADTAPHAEGRPGARWAGVTHGIAPGAASTGARTPRPARPPAKNQGLKPRKETPAYRRRSVLWEGSGV
ncbi:unnamed protein product [Lepidochelys olivacea]